MDERREFPRYTVTSLPDLMASIAPIDSPQHRKFVRLISVGMGGCAFLGDISSSQLLTRRSLFINLEFPGVLYAPLQIPGEIRYGMPSADGSQQIVFGVAFETGAQVLLKPLVDALELLTLQGRIERASEVSQSQVRVTAKK